VKTHQLARTTALLRLAWGGVLLLGTGPVLRRFGNRPTRVPMDVGRVLGARQLAQGLATALAPEPPVLTAGAAVDTLHALTGVGLAVAARRWRTVALTDAAIAGALAASGWWLGSRGRRPA
jgi:hypothetical protein